MKKITGAPGAMPLELMNPRSQKYMLRWGETDNEDGSATYYAQEFDHRPTDDEIKTLIVESINDETTKEITEGMIFNNEKVWLTAENQRNYTMAAVAGIVPYAIKVGDTDSEAIHTFTETSALKDFQAAIATHIANCLAMAWKRKSEIDLSIFSTTKKEATTPETNAEESAE